MLITDLEYLENVDSQSPLVGGSSSPYVIDLCLDGFVIHLDLGLGPKKPAPKPTPKPKKKNPKVVKKVSHKKGAKAVAVGYGKGAKAYTKVS